jgi:hypothetical protein
MTFTGQPIDAIRAERHGIINYEHEMAGNIGARGAACIIEPGASLDPMLPGMKSGSASWLRVGRTPPILRRRSSAARRRLASTISGSSSKPIAFSVLCCEPLVQGHLHDRVELRSYPHSCTCFPDAAFEEIANPQLAANLLHVNRSALVCEC